jgi:6-phosphofructokinase 2
VVPQKKHTHASAAYAVSWGALTFEEPFKGYHVSLILTLTINPAIDRTVTVDKLVFEDRGYILARGESAGGRGINASQVIHSFGGKTLALLTSGGEAGQRMEKSLSGMGFPFEAVNVGSESRINLTISDKQGLTVKLNELGAPLQAQELHAIRELAEALLEKAHWLMICGSIQPGVPPHYYCELIELAKARGVKTLLDTDGEALHHALEAKPSVISPNQPEAERLLGRALLTRNQFLEAVVRIHAMGPESVILKLGSRGAIGMSEEGIFEALPPRVDALSPIGSGDALDAAFVWSRDKGKTFAESLRWGVAAGTATAALPGIRFPSLRQTRAIYKQVEVRPAG